MHKTISLHHFTGVVLLLMVVLSTACQGQMHLGLMWPETGPALTPEFAKGADNTLYLMDEEGTLHAVTAQGQERWTYRGDNVSPSAPVVSRDGASIYLTTTDGNLISVGTMENSSGRSRPTIPWRRCPPLRRLAVSICASALAGHPLL